MNITDGWIRDLVATVAKEEVIKAIAAHENTKLEVSDYEFEIGDKVLKFKGDYNLEGIVVGRFKMTNGAVRFVIEHEAKPKGSFCHIYSSTQLQKVQI